MLLLPSPTGRPRYCILWIERELDFFWLPRVVYSAQSLDTAFMFRHALGFHWGSRTLLIEW